jgi:hypothetical protein
MMERQSSTCRSQGRSLSASSFDHEENSQHQHEKGSESDRLTSHDEQGERSAMWQRIFDTARKYFGRILFPLAVPQEQCPNISLKDSKQFMPSRNTVARDEAPP